MPAPGFVEDRIPPCAVRFEEPPPAPDADTGGSVKAAQAAYATAQADR